MTLRNHREGVVSPLGAIRATGTSPRLGTRRREGQRRSVPELGHEGQAALARPMQGVVVAKVPRQSQGGHREYGGAQLEQGAQHGGEPHQVRGERGGRLGGVCAALRPSRTTRGLGPFGRLRSRFGLASGLVRVAADALLEAHRTRPPLLDTHQGEREEGKPWHRRAVQAGEEPIEALGVLARFRDADGIASAAGAIRRAGPMGTKAHPQQPRPREDGGEQALDGARAATFAGPVGEAQPRDASRAHQHGKASPTQAAGGRHRDMGSEALEQCSNVHHGLLRRLSVVVVDSPTTAALPSRKFWRRYCSQ